MSFSWDKYTHTIDFRVFYDPKGAKEQVFQDQQ